MASPRERRESAKTLSIVELKDFFKHKYRSGVGLNDTLEVPDDARWMVAAGACITCGGKRVDEQEVALAVLESVWVLGVQPLSQGLQNTTFCMLSTSSAFRWCWSGHNHPLAYIHCTIVIVWASFPNRSQNSLKGITLKNLAKSVWVQIYRDDCSQTELSIYPVSVTGKGTEHTSQYSVVLYQITIKQHILSEQKTTEMLMGV